MFTGVNQWNTMDVIYAVDEKSTEEQLFLDNIIHDLAHMS